MHGVSGSRSSPGPVVEPARHLMLRAGLGQHRPLALAAVHRIAAAGVEGAAGWRIDRARHVAVDFRLQAFDPGIGHRHGSQQRLGIGMPRIGEQFGLLRESRRSGRDTSPRRGG